jgi:hypothetical protein
MTTIAGRQIDLIPADIERVAAQLDPEPIDVHFAVVSGRRFPPKQLIEAATGLDRADFNSHQARGVLQRLGFTVDRRQPARIWNATSQGPHGGAETLVLDQYVGRWVAQDGLDVLFAADSPQEVARWLSRRGRTARVWRVPTSPAEAGSTSSSQR